MAAAAEEYHIADYLSLYVSTVCGEQLTEIIWSDKWAESNALKHTLHRELKFIIQQILFPSSEHSIDSIDDCRGKEDCTWASPGDHAEHCGSQLGIV